MKRPVHFEILADDPQRCSEFYRDVLGWEITPWQGGEYLLVTTGSDDDPGINGGIMSRHFKQAVINTAEVESLEAAMDTVRAAGGTVVHGPNEIPGVGNHVYCADPEGNLFGLLQPAAE